MFDSFEGSGILVFPAKDSLQAPGLAVQFLSIKEQYECVVKLVEKKRCKQCKTASQLEKNYLI